MAAARPFLDKTPMTRDFKIKILYTSIERFRKIQVLPHMKPVPKGSYKYFSAFVNDAVIEKLNRMERKK